VRMVSRVHFGRMPPQVVENLVWLYTEPADVVFDPFLPNAS
jgi:DNA modification methylase